MDCILLTWPIGYFSTDKVKNISFLFWILQNVREEWENFYTKALHWNSYSQSNN